MTDGEKKQEELTNLLCEALNERPIAMVVAELSTIIANYAKKQSPLSSRWHYLHHAGNTLRASAESICAFATVTSAWELQHNPNGHSDED